MSDLSRFTLPIPLGDLYTSLLLVHIHQPTEQLIESELEAFGIKLLMYPSVDR